MGSEMTTESASQLDAADPLARFRSRFVATDDPSVVAYLDGNSLGRPLTVTGERLAAFVAGGITLPILTPIVTPDKLGETIEALAP